jgi:hypothetical protein
MKASLNNVENSQCEPYQEGLISSRKVFGMNTKDRQQQKKAQHSKAKDAC